MTAPDELGEAERLGPHHDLLAFRSGNDGLDEWLCDNALTSDGIGTTRTFVTAADGRITGYFTLMVHSLRKRDMPAMLGHGTPEQVPAVMIARLALVNDLHGRGLGRGLLIQALRKSILGMDLLGGRLIFVDAIDPAAETFYEKFGFVRFSDPSRLGMKASAVRKALGSVATWT